MTPPGSTRSAPAKVLALAQAEFRLLFRNKTVFVTAIVMPLLLGLWMPWSFADAEDPVSLAVASTVQMGVVLAFVVYYAVVATLVARRNSRVFKRYRTSGTSDLAVVAGMLAPPVVIAVGLVALLAAANPLLGLPFPADPLALAVAVVAGLALSLTAGAATTLFTRNPEQASITTLPGMMVLLVAPVAAVPVALLEGPYWQYLLLLPGVGVGHFAAMATDWTAASTVPLLLALASVVAWPAVFAVLTRRRFRWDPRT